MEHPIRLSTSNVTQLLYGFPDNHQHCRLILKTDQTPPLILTEALVAAIVRSYVTIQTHPVRQGVEMTAQLIQEPKSNYTSWQLLETDRADKDIQAEIAAYMS